MAATPSLALTAVDRSLGTPFRRAVPPTTQDVAGPRHSDIARAIPVADERVRDGVSGDASVDLADAPAARPSTRAYRAVASADDRRAAADFLHQKGTELRPAYAVLCLAHWVVTEAGREAVCAADVRALYPRELGVVSAPLRDPASHLRRASEVGLLEPLGDGWYRPTKLGAAVVAALPDGQLVGAILGRRAASCTVRLRREASTR